MQTFLNSTHEYSSFFKELDLSVHIWQKPSRCKHEFHTSPNLLIHPPHTKILETLPHIHHKFMALYIRMAFKFSRNRRNFHSQGCPPKSFDIMFRPIVIKISRICNTQKMRPWLLLNKAKIKSRIRRNTCIDNIFEKICQKWWVRFFYVFEDILKKQTVSNSYYIRNLSTTWASTR